MHILSDAKAFLEEFTALLRIGGRRVRSVVVGSVRRGEARVGDLDVLVVAREGAFADLACAASPQIKVTPLEGGARRLKWRVLWLRDCKGYQFKVDLFLATPAEYPYALFALTGPRAYNIRIRRHAKVAGLCLNQYGLTRDGRAVRGSRSITTERQLCALLGVTYRPPEER